MPYFANGFTLLFANSLICEEYILSYVDISINYIFGSDINKLPIDEDREREERGRMRRATENGTGRGEKKKTQNYITRQVASTKHTKFRDILRILGRRKYKN